MSDTTFDGAGLENALKTGGLEGKKASTVVIGMVKASEHASHIGFTTAGCESWIDLPITMVDSAKHLGESRCKDHSHPLMEIALKGLDSPQAKILAALLAQSNIRLHQNQAFQSQGMAGFPQHMSNVPVRDGVVRRVDNRANGSIPISPSAKPFQQPISVGLGGLGGGSNAGLGAWGCWDSCCEACCGQWVVRQIPGQGPIQVCDYYYCCDPCTKCIWPY